MNTPFDPKKALLEELEGLQTVKKAIRHMINDAEQRIGQAEIQLNAAKLTNGFLDIEIERKQSVLREILEKEKEG